MITDRDTKYLGHFLRSIKNEPVSLYLFEGIEGHIGRGRAKGFSYGNAPYVGWADPDDSIVPGAYTECLGYLKANPSVDGVYMYENVMFNDKFLRINRNPHHLTIVKRSIVQRLESEIEANWFNPETCINSIKTLICIPKVGYNYIIRNDSFTGHKAKHINPTQVKANDK